MAQKDNKGKEDEQRSVNSDESSSSDNDSLHPLEYIEMQENGELQNYLNPLREEEEEQGGTQNMEQQGSGSKGKILTSDGLEYE